MENINNDNNRLKSTLHKVSMDLIPYARSDGKFQVYDYRNNILLDLVHDKVQYLDGKYFSSKSCVIVNNGLFAIMHSVQQPTHAPFYEQIKVIHTQLNVILVIAKKEGYFGVVNDKSEVVLPFTYDEIEYVGHEKNSFFKYSKDNLWGLFHLETFEEVLELEYDAIISQKVIETENILLINKSGTIGFIELSTLFIYYIDKEVLAINYSEGICALRYKDGWRFIVAKSNQLITKNTYTSARKMKNGFALCQKDDTNILLFSNGTEINIGKKGENYQRSGDLIYYLEYNENIVVFKLYKRETFISSFSIPWRKWSLPFVKTIDDSFLEISEAYYGCLSNVVVYDLEGLKLYEKPDYFISDNEEHLGRGATKVNILETNWKIENTSLFFNEVCVYKNTEQIEEIYIEGFFSGIAGVIEIFETSPEFGQTSNLIGYIDVNGNKYWD